MLTSVLQGRRVVELDKKQKLRKVGKVRSFVFHPSEKRVVGMLVRRPDAAMMFHRKDAFVRLGAFVLDTDENCIRIEDVADAMDHKAEKALGVDLDECVLWWGMPVCLKDETDLGVVSDVDFDLETGRIRSIEIETGSASKDVLLGKRTLTADQVLGFRKGVGQALVTEDGEWDEDAMRGAILVDDSAMEADTKGGLAEKAGAATAHTSQKVRVVVKKAKPKVDAASEVAGEAAEKALYATGKQLGRASGMFAAFKEEFDKARNE